MNILLIMSYKSANTEYSRLSTVIEKITNDVTRALEKNLGEIIENEKNVNNCLMNIIYHLSLDYIQKRVILWHIF